MRARLFATSVGNWVMLEIARMFAEGFEAVGVPAEVVLDRLPEERPERDLLQLVVAPHEFYPLFAEASFGPAETDAATRGAWLLTVEKPGTSWYDIGFAWAGRARGVVDINASAVRAMAEQGLQAVHAPLGWSPCLEAGTNGPAPKSIDVLFLGVHSPRRELFLAEQADFFSGRRCHFALPRLEKPRRETTPGFLSGAERNRLLRASRLLLNVRFLDTTRYFEWHRVMAAMANRCLVVTEPSEDFAPLVAGRHLVVSELAGMPAACARYLDSPVEAEEAVEAAYRLITRELTMAASCRRVLEAVGRA